jgi:PKD repeat protein
VTASGAASTDTDANPIASYQFTFGDNTPAVVTNAPTAVATHTYANAGTYTVTLTATDTGGLTSTPVTAPVTVSATPPPPNGTLSVYVGYYDTHHADETHPKPNPWSGASGVVFVGTPDSPSGGWDSSTLRIDNNSGSSVTLTATVDIGSNHYALWGSRTIPAGQKLILAQTGFQNFDGSDTSPAGCYGCDPKLCLTKVVSTVPVVNVTVGGVTTRFYDSGQVMNTKGADGAGCPPINGRRDESTNWVQVFTTGQVALTMDEAITTPGTTSAGTLWLAPPYPNPVRDDLSLRFHTARRGIVNLEIYDVAGRLVTSALDNDLEPGEYVKVVPVRSFMAGRYFARLRTSEGELRQSFVITR